MEAGMLRRLAVLALCLGVGATAAIGAEREVSIERDTLHGTLSLPDRPGRVAAVLLIAGSGPTDRDGNSGVPGVKPATLKLIANGLAANGIASLRFDKRGIGASRAAMVAEQDMRFSILVEDAVQWAAFLKAQPQVGCVFVLGHSEGALIGALVAAKVEVCGFVSVAGAGFPGGEILRRQLHAQALPAPLAEFSDAALTRLEQGGLVENVPPALAPLFRPSVQPYLISWFAVDPARAVGALHRPILLLQGTTDIQVSVDDARALAAGAPAARLVLLDGINHVLKVSPAERSANLATYGDPTLPLAPAVMPAILDFVRSHS
jgi:uncharacterized protein